VIADDGLRGAVAAGLCLYPFAYEITATVGPPPGHAGRRWPGATASYTYDLLAAALGSRSRSTLVCIAFAAVAAAGAQAVARVPVWAGLLVLAGVIAASTTAGIALWSRRAVTSPADANPKGADGPDEVSALRTRPQTE
jgi:hypothetical protein